MSTETTKKLHPDWPEADLGANSWDLPAPVDELESALDGGDFGTATGPSHPADPVALTDIARVVRYAVSWHGEGDQTGPEFSSGTELDLALVAELVDGRWISIVAWNDYTGWGCQDGSDVRVGDTEQQVVEFGLDESSRQRLGYEAAS